MSAPLVRKLGAAPNRQQAPEQLVNTADAFFGQMPGFASDLRVLADYLNNLAVLAGDSIQVQAFGLGVGTGVGRFFAGKDVPRADPGQIIVLGQISANHNIAAQIYSHRTSGSAANWLAKIEIMSVAATDGQSRNGWYEITADESGDRNPRICGFSWNGERWFGILVGSGTAPFTVGNSTATGYLPDHDELFTLLDQGAVTELTTDYDLVFPTSQSGNSSVVKRYNGYPMYHGGNLPLPSDLRYKVRTVKELPLNWQDIDDAAATNQWYPQGFTYDDVGWLLVHYGDTGNSKGAIVVYDERYAYRGWFTVRSGGESIVATGSFEGGDLDLYKRDSTGGGQKLVKYDIGALPANGTNFNSPSTKLASGVGLQFAKEGDQWIVEQSTVDIGEENSRTKWNLFDSDFNFLTSVYIPITVVGYQLPSSALYEYVPKIQGMALRGGDLILSVGGSYQEETDGATSPTVADLGVARLSSDGSVLDYAVLRSDRFLQKLQDDGHNAVKTENEGVALHPQTGDLHTLCVTLRPSSTGADQGGLLVLSHYDPRGRDYRRQRSLYLPASVNEMTRGVLRRASSGGFQHPLTGAAITSMSALLDLIVHMQLPRAAYFSAAVPLTPLASMDVPAGNYAVEILNHNNDSFSVRVLGTTSQPHLALEYMVFGSVGAWSAQPRYYRGVAKAVISDAITSSVTGETTEQQLKSYTIPGRLMMANGLMEIEVELSCSDNANSKALTVELNGVEIHRQTSALTNTENYRVNLAVQNRNSTSSQYFRGENAFDSFGKTGVGHDTATINTDADMTLTISVTPSDAADTMAIERVFVTVTPFD